MTPLPPNNTPRFKVFYENAVSQHVQEYRSHLSPVAVGAFVDQLWTALGVGVYATTITEVQFAADGSDIFNAVTTGIEGNDYGTGTPTLQFAPWYFNFIARSAGGRRLRLAFFGAQGIGTNYRFAPGESTQVDNTIGILQSLGNDIRVIDDLTPVWKVYANAGVNAHWQKRVR